MSKTAKRCSQGSRQGGYTLLSVMLLVTLMMIALAAELPRMAQQIKRDKEEEMIHRGKEYAMAIKRYVHSRYSNGNYPLTLEQLESTNNIRFLRKRFKDPMTADGEWKLVHLGEAEIKMTPGGIPGAPGAPGVNPLGGAGTLTPGSSVTPSPSPSPSPSGFGSPGGFGSTTTSTGPGSTGFGSTTANTPQGGGFIIGVVSTSKATSIREFNDTNRYDQWMFVYDKSRECVMLPGGSAPIAGPTGMSSPATGAGLTTMGSPSTAAGSNALSSAGAAQNALSNALSAAGPACQGNGIFIAAPLGANGQPPGSGTGPSPSGSPRPPQPGVTPAPPSN